MMESSESIDANVERFAESHLGVMFKPQVKIGEEAES